MARIPLIDHHRDDTDPKARALLRAADGQWYGALNVHRAMANHPDAMEKLFELMSIVYLDNSLPDSRTRELPYLTSAIANNCFY